MKYTKLRVIYHKLIFNIKEVLFYTECDLYFNFFDVDLYFNWFCWWLGGTNTLSSSLFCVEIKK